MKVYINYIETDLLNIYQVLNVSPKRGDFYFNSTMLTKDRLKEIQDNINKGRIYYFNWKTQTLWRR
jgi:hypothetical protein